MITIRATNVGNISRLSDGKMLNLQPILIFHGMDRRKLLNSELHRLTVDEFRNTEKNGIVLILDNVRSAHNVGSAFRTADAFLADEVALCGICAVPPSPEIHKTALGAENSVLWKHFDRTEDAVAYYKERGYRIIAVEQTENSVMLDDFAPSDKEKYAFIFGNEVKGVCQEAVDLSDFSVEIPQYGTKHSLNVSVSVGIVLWDFMGKRRS